MSTKSEINISTIWYIFKVEIVLEAPGWKLISKSRWGKDEKRSDFFFSFLWGEQKKEGGGQLTFYSIFSGGKSMLCTMHFYFFPTKLGLAGILLILSKVWIQLATANRIAIFLFLSVIFRYFFYFYICFFGVGNKNSTFFFIIVILYNEEMRVGYFGVFETNLWNWNLNWSDI